MSVAVIVPVAEPAPFLREALASLPADPVVVRDVNRRGPAWARNVGLGRLTDGTEWVGFCDADDVWLPGKLDAQLARAAEADVLVGSAVIVDAAGAPTGEEWGEPDFSRLYEANPILLSSVLVRRELLDEVGGFDESLAQAEDWDLWLRLLARGARFAWVPSARVRYRRHPGGLTRDVAALAEAQIEVHERHRGSVDEAVARRVLAADWLALGAGRFRQGEWAEGRRALEEAGRLGVVPLGARVRGVASRVPGVRVLLGRRAPYRG